MQEGETRHAVKKRDDHRTGIEALVVRLPCLQGTAGHLKHLGRLTLREPLSLQVAILCKQLRAFDTMPALGARIIAALRLLDDQFHSSLLLKPLSWENGLAKDDEGALLVQPFTLSRRCLSGVVVRDQVADAVIEAQKRASQ